MKSSSFSVSVSLRPCLAMPRPGRPVVLDSPSSADVTLGFSPQDSQSLRIPGRVLTGTEALTAFRSIRPTPLSTFC